MNFTYEVNAVTPQVEAPAGMSQIIGHGTAANASQVDMEDPVQELKKLQRLNGAYEDLMSTCASIYAIGGLGRIVKLLNIMNTAYLDQLHDDMGLRDFIAMKDEACSVIELTTFFVDLDMNLELVEMAKSQLK